MELIGLMKAVGNGVSNGIYEANLGNTLKPEPKDDRQTKETFIKNKYVKRTFIKTPPTGLTNAFQAVVSAGFSPDKDIRELWAKDATGPLVVEYRKHAALHKAALQAARVHDVSALVHCFALGANLDLPDASGRTCMHFGAASGNLPVVEFLCQNGSVSTPSMLDNNGNAPLHICQQLDRVDCAALLLKRGAILPSGVTIATDAEEADTGADHDDDEAGDDVHEEVEVQSPVPSANDNSVDVIFSAPAIGISKKRIKVPADINLSELRKLIKAKTKWNNAKPIDDFSFVIRIDDVGRMWHDRSRFID